MSEKTLKCPGCGLSLIAQQLEWTHQYNATGECYQKYSELSLYTMSLQDVNFIHQHAIDTYSAQHAGDAMKNITVVYSLIGLYYAIEYGFSGKQVQRVHILLSQQKTNWPALQTPKKEYSLTVADVLKEEPGEGREMMLKKWMLDVWECWEHQHNWIKNVTNTLLS
ncbi:DUF5946 family protein [Neobacillus drentensis]|uniref:DUF5946 family protein n=1 Tax=Neobacillus drentensis TaxID=220684 RepID=UPI002FFF77ED